MMPRRIASPETQPAGHASQQGGDLTYYSPGAVVDVNGHPVSLRCGDDVAWHLDAGTGGPFTASARSVPQGS